MRFFVVLLVATLICGFAFAEQTGRGVYTTPIDPLTNWLNNNNDFYHSHGYDLPDPRVNPMGLGIDLTVYEFEGKLNENGLDSIEIQNKWDMRNSEYSLYGVVKANPWKVVKKWLNL